MASGKESVVKVTNSEEKKKALDAAIAKLEKDFGKGAVMKLGESGAHVSVETVPTGCLSLDLALGLGGVPKGRVIEVYGPESSGKTTVALHMISEVQKRGGIAGFIDAEHALDPVYAKNIGVDIDELYISQPDSGDQALEIAETMVRSGAIDIIVIDSVAALVPKQEIEGDMGDSHVGLQARLMSQALRKLTPVISKSNCVVIFINQLREKVGVMFGNPETTTGGRALKFYASVRMDVRRIETLKQNGEIVGNRTRIKIVALKKFFYVHRSFLPEQLVQCLAQHLADAAAEVDRRVILPFFNGVDGLAGHAHHRRQIRLGHIQRSAGGLQLQILCHCLRFLSSCCDFTIARALHYVKYILLFEK